MVSVGAGGGQYLEGAVLKGVYFRDNLSAV